MLNLHVRLHVVLVHDVLPLLAHHLRLRVLRMHHWYIVGMGHLWSVPLLLSDWIGSVRSRSMLLLMLRRTLAWRRLVVHRQTHVSLKIRIVR